MQGNSDTWVWSMLNILMMDYNFYQRMGLSFLIFERLDDEHKEDIFFLLPTDERNEEIADIIFRNDMVTIHVDNKGSFRGVSDFDYVDEDQGKKTIHIPFLTKNQSINDVLFKLKKLLAIARADCYSLADKDDVYWTFGLKKYAQLSHTEKDVMILIGRGYNNADISKILKRSIKTISTHYRNASRKMGAANRAEFYRYASFIANCQREDRNTLCL